MMKFIEQIAKAILNEELTEYDKTIMQITAENELLENKIDELTYSSPKEKYYNEKYPFKDLTYARNERSKTYQIDVRSFIQPNFNYPKFEGTHDEIVKQALDWVINKIKYVADLKQYGNLEYWCFPFETLEHKQGDCEDGAILLASILLHNKIPYWKIRISTGWAFDPFSSPQKKVGHAYCTYYCEETDKWVVLDWCWYPDKNEINKMIDYKENPYYKEVWFSFNNKYSWSEGLNENANKLLNK